MIVDWNYFTEDYLGLGVNEVDFPRLNMRAEELIDLQTRSALKGFDNFTEEVQTLVKKAICAQIEYYGEFGENVGFKAEDSGFTVGKVSVQSGQGEGEKSYLSPRALGFLELAGLLGRRVAVC